MFSPDGDYFGFKNINFGVYGSDEVTVALMSYAHEILIEFWEGVPRENGSELLLAATYKAEPQWNTYIENIFKLNKKLTGNKCICIALKTEQTVSFRDIIFKNSAAFEKHTAADNISIYGDSYTISVDNINGIGNNVTINFGEFDFDDALSAIELCGCSYVPLGSVHIKFSNAESNETITEVIEVPAGKSCETRKYPLSRITGKQNISFIFLPGSNFDFAWFKFCRVYDEALNQVPNA